MLVEYHVKGGAFASSGTVFFETAGVGECLQHQVFRFKQSEFPDAARRFAEFLRSIETADVRSQQRGHRMSAV